MKRQTSELICFLWLTIGFVGALFWLGPLLMLGGVFVLASSASRGAKTQVAAMLVGVALGYAAFFYMDARGMIGWK